MRRLLSLGVSFVMASLLAPLVAAEAQARSRKPNIIFIHADDLGYGDLSCYGQKRFTTPSLDRMAQEGIRFTQYYSGSTVCAPSRGALMTGLHTGHAYIRGNGDIPLRPADVTVAEVLKAMGYTTAVIGKWGLGTEDTTGRPDRQGFDYSFGYLHHIHAHRQYTDHLWRNGKKVRIDPAKDFTSDLFTEEAISFIQRNRRRPFFLYQAYSVPHAELLVPEDGLAPLRGRFVEKAFIHREADEIPSTPPWHQRGYRSQRHPRAAFAAMVTRLDHAVGRILQAVKDAGIAPDTLVLFTSDNGPHREGGHDPSFFASSGPLRGIKRDLYEGGIRVPMIAWWPGTLKAGAVSDQVWAHWDFLPTAAELAGAKPPEAFDGESMLAALTGERALPRRKPLYWEFFERGVEQALRDGDWKAVRRGLDRPLEVYDLRTDAGESSDVAKANPEVVTRLEALLAAARSESEHPLWRLSSER